MRYNFDHKQPSNNNEIQHFMVGAAQLILGANNTIALITDWEDYHGWGLPIQDLAAMADNRLELKCLVPLPKPEHITKSFNPIDTLHTIIDHLHENQWVVKIANEKSSLTTTLLVDNTQVIFRKNWENGVTFVFSDNQIDVRHYREQFNNAWELALSTTDFNTLYTSKIIEETDKTPSLIQFSNETWNHII